MPRVHHVKSARRPLPSHGIEVGDSYYWWAYRMRGMRSGRKFFSKTYPKQSQLTQSDYYRAVYSLQEGMSAPEGGYTSSDDLTSDRDGWAQEAREIGQEQQDKLDNMPEGLQQGDTGQLLEARASACESWGDEIESVEIHERDAYESDDDFRQALQEAFDEITSLEPNE